jgi:beta-phosphoglucomutase family hydrolase
MYDNFDALIFDMDGTLVDSGQLHEYAWTSMLNHYSIPVDRPLMRSLAGVPTDATIRMLLNHFQRDTHHLTDEMVRLKNKIVDEQVRRFVRPTALLDIVRQYHGKKPMAIGTGASTEEAMVITRLCGLDVYMDAIVGADQVLNPKPAPDIFLRCAELLKVTTTRCVVFEDSQLGLQAARSAGMKAIDVLAIHQIVNEYFL